MTEKEYNKLYEIADKLCDCKEHLRDLLHDVILSLSLNEKYNNLNSTQQRFYFVRVIENQCHSSTSPFHRTYRRFVWNEITNEQNKPDEYYVPRPDMKWVEKTLSDELDNNPKFWYDKGLFELYLRLGSMEKVHKNTTIPRYEVQQNIKNTKHWLKKKWLKEYAES